MNRRNLTYQLRNKKLELQELVDLAAVRSKSDAPSKSQKSVIQLLSSEAALPEVRLFEDAGWSFVPRQQASDGARVYLKPDGRVALGTNRLTIRVGDGQSEQEAAELLAQNGLVVEERLKFAPNMFVVSVPNERHPLEEATRLLRIGEIQFAEPEFLEALSGR